MFASAEHQFLNLQPQPEWFQSVRGPNSLCFALAEHQFSNLQPRPERLQNARGPEFVMFCFGRARVFESTAAVREAPKCAWPLIRYVLLQQNTNFRIYEDVANVPQGCRKCIMCGDLFVMFCLSRTPTFESPAEAH